MISLAVSFVTQSSRSTKVWEGSPAWLGMFFDLWRVMTFLWLLESSRNNGHSHYSVDHTFLYAYPCVCSIPGLETRVLRAYA